MNEHLKKSIQMAKSDFQFLIIYQSDFQVLAPLTILGLTGIQGRSPIQAIAKVHKWPESVGPYGRKYLGTYGR